MMMYKLYFFYSKIIPQLSSYKVTPTELSIQVFILITLIRPLWSHRLLIFLSKEFLLFLLFNFIQYQKLIKYFKSHRDELMVIQILARSQVP
ncbi:MAG: hypothetical protein DSY77_03535 [Bacteroidetes bacterium]|nr:MAG: hypothetical protein DSY77_03535 [Bacteroidota bacterium]